MTFDDELYDTEINWKLAPRPNTDPDPQIASTPDVVGLAFADILTLESRVDSLVADCASYRELAEIALDMVTELTADLKRSNATVKMLRNQIAQLLGVDMRDDSRDT